jgi:hypothetical protein
MNIRWSQAETMRDAVIALGQQCNVVVYHPQTDEVILPTIQAPKRSWFKRRG